MACAGGISTAPIPIFANKATTNRASIMARSEEEVRRRACASRLSFLVNVREPVDAIASLRATIGSGPGQDGMPAAGP